MYAYFTLNCTLFDGLISMRPQLKPDTFIKTLINLIFLP